MAIKFNRSFADSRQLISLKVIGDGTTTSFSFSLDSIPVLDEGYPFGNPTGVFVTNAGADGASATISGNVVTVTFSTAPDSGELNQVELVPLYDSV